jgi:tripeptide aminopeptidase
MLDWDKPLSEQSEHVREVFAKADKEEAEKMVRIGDAVTVELAFREMPNNRAASPAMDDKCGMWVVMEALRRADKSKLKCGLYAVSTVQEEVGLEGAKALDVSKIGQVDRAFNFDGGTVEKLTTGAIGGERMTIKVTGKPAHAGVAPETGVSAIVIASRAIADLDSKGWLGKVIQADQAGTANVGVINGGDATNVITPEVVLRAEARSHSAEFRTEIVSQIRTAFERAGKSYRCRNPKMF